MSLDNRISDKLIGRHKSGLFRRLAEPNELIDFCSNDYLGFARSEKIAQNANALLASQNRLKNGSASSRLIRSNSPLANQIEERIAEMCLSEDALLFNSGYNANLGYFSCVPQRGDVILYDEKIHASIKDGMKLSNAKSYSFKHNDLDSLREKLDIVKSDQNTFLVIESVYSMDGDSPDLKAFAQFATNNFLCLVVDEAHSFAVHGSGLMTDLNLQDYCYARIITFGKALGAHGACVVGSENLKHYLVNYSRPLIYTTMLSPHSLCTISAALDELVDVDEVVALKHSLYFQSKLASLELNFIQSESCIVALLCPGNEKVKELSAAIEKDGFDVKAILSPTVKEGEERIRFCFHAFNTNEQIDNLIKSIQSNV